MDDYDVVSNISEQAQGRAAQMVLSSILGDNESVVFLLGEHTDTLQAGATAAVLSGWCARLVPDDWVSCPTVDLSNADPEFTAMTEHALAVASELVRSRMFEDFDSVPTILNQAFEVYSKDRDKVSALIRSLLVYLSNYAAVLTIVNAK